MDLNQLISNGAISANPMPTGDQVVERNLPPVPISNEAPPPAPPPPTPEQSFQSAHSENMAKLKDLESDLTKKLTDWEQTKDTATRSNQSMLERYMVEKEAERRELSRMSFPSMEPPKPPVVQDSMKNLGTMGQIMTGIMAIAGAIGGKKGAMAFVNSYNGMVDSFREYDTLQFKKANESFRNELESFRITQENRVAQYQDQFKKWMLGREDVAEMVKLSVEANKNSLAMTFKGLELYKQLNDARIKMVELTDSHLWQEHIAQLNNESRERAAKTRTESGGTQYKDFVAQYLQDHPGSTRGQAEAAFDKRKSETQKTMIDIRYPPFQQGTGLLPGVIFNRKTGKYIDSTTGKEMDRGDLIASYGDRAVMEADKSALRDLTKRKELISTFANRIDVNVPIVLDAVKDIENNNPRLLNQALNESKQYLEGSGKWQALQTATLSLSNEVQRLESNSLGIGGQGENERKMWAKVHDPNMKLSDWKELSNMVLKLSKTAVESVEKQRQDLIKRIPKEARGEFEEPGGSGSESVKPQNETKILNGKTYFKQDGKWFEQ